MFRVIDIFLYCEWFVYVSFFCMFNKLGRMWCYDVFYKYIIVNIFDMMWYIIFIIILCVCVYRDLFEIFNGNIRVWVFWGFIWRKCLFFG